MKKLIAVLSLVIALNASAQKVTTSAKSEQVKGESAEGYTTTLDAKSEEVSAAWSRFLKDMGKFKPGSGYQYVENPAMGGTVYQTGIVYSKTSGNAESGTVWLGIKAAEWTVNDIKTVNNQLEKLVYQFGVKFYRDKIQAQINEAQEALNIVLRQQERLSAENKTLNTRLATNEQMKIQLEKSLENNKLEHLVLQQKIVNNLKAQDSVTNTKIPIKKAIEAHRERLRKVN